MVGCEIDRDRRSDSPLTHDSSNLSKNRRDLSKAKTAVHLSVPSIILLSVVRRQRTVRALLRGRDDPVATATAAFFCLVVAVGCFVYSELAHPLILLVLRAAGGAPLASEARPAAEPARAGELSRRVAPPRRTGARGVIGTILLQAFNLAPSRRREA